MTSWEREWRRTARAVGRLTTITTRAQSRRGTDSDAHALREINDAIDAALERAPVSASEPFAGGDPMPCMHGHIRLCPECGT